MTDSDYANFCNLAYGFRKAAEDFCAKLGDEEARQLGELVRMEMWASPGAGDAGDACSFLAAILAGETAERDAQRERGGI
ncbi:hypothetical protein GGQ64_002591 [Rhizobium azooxidifex]|uniref:Uncharacterized protein n=1 Tax=Mycoplana azooxidifex TaxID=1636188 RepID=A0A7W6DAU7_9HYPH|nr:hypothetical protein [Mycoplana azooxidifex]MBB3977385.1 hypothetical protein [Mycoplana azooxidifex]